MNELIKVNVNEKQEPIISARELHEFLEISTHYKDWFPRMVEYGFEEGQDFCSFLSESTGGRRSVEHHITIDMAKELCMIQRNDKGKQARQYFISVEKEFNSPEKLMARALKIADETIHTLRIENESMKPKAIFADAVSASKTSILVGELAKLLKQNGIDIGQNRLFEWLRNNGYLIKRRGTDYNMPTQYSMKLGLFEVKETAFTHSDGHVTISKTPKVTGKGQIYFVNKLKGGAA